MLKNLRIRNYALVEDLEVEFGPGLNVITGATGAGKSIIVGAVNLILGERASSEAVRTGFDSASIEAVFELTDDRSLESLLRGLGIVPQENMLIIRREISSKAQSRCYVNDRLITQASLKSIGDRLADLHGQHEHQSLLNVERHVEYLDHYGDLDGILSEVSETYRLLKEKQKELDDLEHSTKLDEERRRLYEFQIQEIEKAQLSPDEEEKLVGERKVLENVESLFELSGNLYHQLYESEDSLLRKLTLLSREMKRGEGIDSRLKEPDETLESCVIKLQEMSRFMEDYRSRLEFDPERLETIRERLNLLNTLKRKYGKSLEEISSYKAQIENEMLRMENRDEILKSLTNEINQCSKILQKACSHLSQRRKAKASELSGRIQKALAGLGMDQTKVEIRIAQQEDQNGLVELDGKRFAVSEKGMDQVEFFVSPNPGEELKPLAKIASGGEISRVMLALKSILAKSDRIQTLIFDEIDVGIGGEVASAVGKSLKDLASSRQVMVITHLQQIASQADHHYKVFKESLKGRTVTRIKRLEREERINEIARMISGEKVSQVTLRQAKEMIRTASPNDSRAN
ncbi:MAG: DNA repair protein RecN [Candidatus Zixiibacteriota bacterium]